MKTNSVRLTFVLLSVVIVLVCLILLVKPSYAHNGGASIDCSGLHISLSNYNTQHANHVSASIDGNSVVDQNFGSGFHADYAIDPTRSHDAVVDVSAWDDPNGSNGWSFHWSGHVDACQQPPSSTPTNTPRYTDTPAPTITPTPTNTNPPPTATDVRTLTPQPTPTPTDDPCLDGRCQPYSAPSVTPVPTDAATPTATPCDCLPAVCETFATSGKEVLAYPLDDGKYWRLVGQDVALPDGVTAHNNGHVYSVLAFIDAGQASALLNGLVNDVTVTRFGVPCSACSTVWGYDELTRAYFFGMYGTVDDLTAFISINESIPYAAAFGEAMRVSSQWHADYRASGALGGWYSVD